MNKKEHISVHQTQYHIIIENTFCYKKARH